MPGTQRGADWRRDRAAALPYDQPPAPAPRRQYPNQTPQADALRDQMLAASAAGRIPQTDPLNDKVDLRFAPDNEVENWIRSNYGYMGAFLHNPEVKSVLFAAARNDWGEAELRGALYATSWWQSTNAAQRTWQQLLAEDPAEARNRVQQQAATINNRARSLGLPMSSGQVAGLAEQVVANGWNTDQYTDALISQVNWATLEGGDLTNYRDVVKSYGGDYMVAVSDTTAQNMAMRIASGELSESGVESIMRQQARARYGYLADQLDQGITVKDYFSSTRDTIAMELGIDSDQIDMMDPKWMKMLEVRDPKTNELRGATLDEARRSARKDEQWANTSGAQNMAASMIRNLSQAFGRSGV